MSTSHTLSKTSDARVVRDADHLIVSALNPENVLVLFLKEYIENTGYSSAFSNFSGVNIGNVHPFGLLLFQDILGNDYDLSVFPSITISDESLAETDDTLSDAYREVVLTEAMVDVLVSKRVIMDGEKVTGELFMSDDTVTSLQASVADGGKIVGLERTLTMRHNISFSIWSQNKTVSDLLFDIVIGFVLSEKSSMFDEGVDLKEVSGSRTGDVNLDFGTILYGASVMVPGYTQKTTITVDESVGVLAESSVDATTTPHTL